MTPSSEIERLLIVRLSAMGDIIHTLPAVAALRAHLPHAKIGWVVEQRWVELLCTLSNARSGARSAQRPLVDSVHVVDTRVWRESPISTFTWQQIAASLSDLRGQAYQAAIDFQGLLRSAVVAKLSRAQVVYGFRNPREIAAGIFYSRQVTPSGGHVVEQNVSLASAVIGGAEEVPPPVFPMDAAAEEQCEARLREHGIGIGSGFSLLNPGAGWGAKRWPSDRYATVAKTLAKDGVPSLVNFGPGEEKLAREVEKLSDGTAKPISSSVTQLISLTRRASLFIGGDTGPLHLAAALRIPVVAIFGPTDPVRNGPFGTRSVVLRSPESRTDHHRSETPDSGILSITAGEVVLAARSLLEQPHG